MSIVMKNMKPVISTKSQQKSEKLAELGIENYAYLRSVDIDELVIQFQIREIEEISQLRLQEEIWVLFSAEGMPLALSEEPADLYLQADELHLKPVNLH